MIDGDTLLIAHVGFPTKTFKAPLIFNPYFRKIRLNAAVVPMGVNGSDYAKFLRPLFQLSNIRGALITMPHKMATVALLDEVSTAVKIAGSCNAVRRREDGKLVGDIFDGEGFVRALARKGRALAGARALVVGSGGVGSAISASLAGANIGSIGLFDKNPDAANSLADRLRRIYPKLDVGTGSSDPGGYDIVVNATPLGMNEGDPMPIDVTRIAKSALVGEVVLKEEITPLLRAARDKGCAIQTGVDMLFEQMPAYLEFFGFPATTAEELRAIAEIKY